MFQENKCYEQHLPEYCCKGYHVRENDRRNNDHEKWQGAPSTRETIGKKRRRGSDASLRHAKTDRERANKLELRLRRLGFSNSKLPSWHELQTAVDLYKETIEASAIADEDKKRKKRKIESAFKYIYKAKQGEDASPNSTDSDTHSLESDAS